jgi:hypothetical protein
MAAITRAIDILVVPFASAMTELTDLIGQGIEFLLSFLFVSFRHSANAALQELFTQSCGFLRIDKVAPD